MSDNKIHTTVDEMWKVYAATLNVDEDSIQYKETRKAFYAGAFNLFHTILVINDNGTDEAITKMMRGFELQYREYVTEVIVTCRK